MPDLITCFGIVTGVLWLVCGIVSMFLKVKQWCETVFGSIMEAREEKKYHD